MQKTDGAFNRLLNDNAQLFPQHTFSISFLFSGSNHITNSPPSKGFPDSDKQKQGPSQPHRNAPVPGIFPVPIDNFTVYRRLYCLSCIKRVHSDPAVGRKIVSGITMKDRMIHVRCGCLISFFCHFRLFHPIILPSISPWTADRRISSLMSSLGDKSAMSPWFFRQ